MTDKPASVFGDLPEGVESVMYLRDGWPRAVVCKVLMKNGCIGIGLVRYPFKTPSPADADAAALSIAMVHVSHEPPDYTALHDHIEKMKAAAAARGQK